MSIPLVSVIMPTYNHEKYIAQAIESVLMQETKFKYLLIIGEDCSKDSTREICFKYANKYPEKIKLLTADNNLGIAQNYKNLFDSCDAEFIAILEGDDYWIDSKKLQKQIKILTKNDDCGFVHTGFEVIYQSGKKKIGHKGLDISKLKGKVLNESPIIDFTISPLTVCFRRDLLQYVDFDFILKNNLQTIDAVLWTEFAYHTKFQYLPEITGCYRVLDSSISNTKDIIKIKNSNNTVRCILKYFIAKYNIEMEIANQLLNRQKMFMIGQYIERNMWYEAEIEAKSSYADSFNGKIKLFVVRNHNCKFAYTLYLKVIKLASFFKQIILN